MDQQPKPRLLRTKVFVPRAHPESVPRARLLRRLDLGLESPLILVSAPAGSGKTTLLADWIHRQGILAGWVSLDAGDNDEGRFWSYVALALGTARPGLGAGALAALQAPRRPPIESILTDLADEVAADSDSLILVLDDYHVVDNPAIHSALEFLLAHQPPRLVLVLASRTDPPLPLARLRARRQLVEVRGNDLLFTPDEVAVLFNQVLGLGLSPDDVSALEARTEGWAAGLQLAALSLQDEPDASAFISAFSGSHRHVFDYLAQEVLQRQTPEVKSFLLRTSILERLSAPLADAVVGEQGAVGGAQAMIEHAEKANLFVVSLDTERRWYRYHHLFAQFLRTRLEDSIGPEELAALHRRAAQWHEAHGLPEDAVRHALATRDTAFATAVFARTVEDMFYRSELGAVVGWARAMPREALEGKPALSMMIAWAMLATGATEEAEESLQAVERAVGVTADALATDKATSLPPGVRLALVEVSVLRGNIALGQFHVPRALELARLALPHLSADDGPSLTLNSLDSLRLVVVFNLGLAQELSGDVAGASQSLVEAADLARHQRNPHIIPVAMSHLAQIQVLRGQLQAAAATYQQAFALASEPTGQISPMAGIAYVGMGSLLYERDELDAAMVHLERGIALARKWNNWESLVPGYVGVARVRAARGDWPGASAALDEISGLCQSPAARALLPAVSTARAALAAAYGDLDTATRWARSTGLTADGDLPYLREPEAISLARVMVAEGRLAEGRRLLGRLLVAVESGQRTGRALEILILQARALRGEGHTPAAHGALARALRLAEPEGYVRTFVDEGTSVEELLCAPAVRTAAPEYAARLLHAFAPSAPARTTPNPRPPTPVARPLSPTTPPAAPIAEPLSDREAQVLRLIAEGLTNDEIARRLVVSINTVKTHVKSVYAKLGADNRTRAVSMGRELGLL